MSLLLTEDVTAPVSAPPARPFLKWAGGKTQLLPALLERLPPTIEGYFEPFIGGGALFFALAGGRRSLSRTVLADSNPELITAYQVVRDRPGALIERLAALEAQYLPAAAEARAAMYYRVREERPRSAVGQAARLIFLNHTCFNGLYRVNRRGEFNVPHGRYRKPRILDQPNIEAASRALADVELLCADFEAACDTAGAGDLVYFDPPFHPLTDTASFTAYTQEGFGTVDQLRLKGLIDRLSRREVAVMLSNSPHPWIVELYERGGYTLPGYRLERVDARRAINSRGDRRGPIDELVVTNYERGYSAK